MNQPKELEIKHLLSYAAYGLKTYNRQTGKIHERDLQDLIYFCLHLKSDKPILKPLSEDELIKTQYLGELQTKGNMLDYISTSKKDSQRNARLLLNGQVDQLEQWKFERLLEFNFDVFGLLEAGLAHSIHDVKEK